MSTEPTVPQTVIDVKDIGSAKAVKPSFMEFWGTIAFFILLGLLICTSFYVMWKFNHVDLPMSLPGTDDPEKVRIAVANHKLINEEGHASLWDLFDLLMTKTAIPLITLLMGYLFGKRASS